MSYRVLAYKGNKVISIPLEEKHKYYNYTATSNGENSISFYPNTGNGINQIAVKPDKFRIIHDSNVFTLAKGTGDQDRVGSKVALKCIDITFYVRLSIDTFINYIPHGELADLSLNMRLLTVHFDDTMSPTLLADWFNKTYIYYYNFATLTPNEQSQSCHQDMLRESSEYTGKFKILHDLKFKLDKNHTIIQGHYQLKPNMNLTFDDSDNSVVNDDFINTYTFLIAPIDYRLDTDATTYNYLSTSQNFNVSRVFAYYGYNVKYTFYDLN